MKELEVKAGFTVDFLQVKPMTDHDLERHMVMLQTKQPWAAAGQTA